jgi:predicted nucleic acid-binding protein
VNAVVLDGSFALSVLLADEFSPAALQTIRAVRAMLPGSRLVPTHFWIEITNAMLMAERRKRVSRSEMEESLQIAFALPLVTDEETSLRCPNETLALAREFSLTVYDAAYLELALRRNAGLATVDKALARAAKAVGVAVIP